VLEPADDRRGAAVDVSGHEEVPDPEVGGGLEGGELAQSRGDGVEVVGDLADAPALVAGSELEVDEEEVEDAAAELEGLGGEEAVGVEDERWHGGPESLEVVDEL